MIFLSATEALSDAAALVPLEQGKRFYFYCIGRGQSVVASRILKRAPAAVPVLLGDSPETLMEERSGLEGVEPMGYVADIFRNNWEASLPTAPLAVFTTCILSSRPDREKRAVLEKVCGRLKPGGVLLWTDLFLPYSLELFEQFQLMEADIIAMPFVEALREVAERHRRFFPVPCLLAKGIELLYECGFGNVAVIWKRFGYTVLAAFR